MVLEVLKNKHDQIVVLELAKILDHEAFDKWLQLAVDHGLRSTHECLALRNAEMYSHL